MVYGRDAFHENLAIGKKKKNSQKEKKITVLLMVRRNTRYLKLLVFIKKYDLKEDTMSHVVLEAIRLLSPGSRQTGIHRVVIF